MTYELKDRVLSRESLSTNCIAPASAFQVSSRGPLLAACDKKKPSPAGRDLWQAGNRQIANLQRSIFEDLVTEIDTNEIQMVGSLRAVKQCIECHSGRRGTLLGVFSYRLRRNPPLPINRAGNGPATQNVAERKSNTPFLRCGLKSTLRQVVPLDSRIPRRHNLRSTRRPILSENR